MKERAGTIFPGNFAAAPHYGEAQSAESRADFIHKMKAIRFDCL